MKKIKIRCCELLVFIFTVYTMQWRKNRKDVKCNKLNEMHTKIDPFVKSFFFKKKFKIKR